MYSFSDKVFDISIFLSALANTTANRVVLFGAGGYGEALLDELIKRGISMPAVFADNDCTKQGRSLRDKAIISPRDLDPSTDIVVITTISAGDQVSNQLESLGFQRDVNYFEVMHSLDYSHPIDVVEFYRKYVGGFEGLDILHAGPGGHLGVELLLYALGAKSVYSVEYYSFRLKYPDVTQVRRFYEQLAKMIRERWNEDLFEWGLLHSDGERLYIDKDKIRLLYPCSITALPFADRSFDLVLHHAVFEHVPNPSKGYKEVFRVLRPGGTTAGMVDPQDHRTFSSFKQYYPLKFLEYSREEWYDIVKDMNPHNQITTPEHKDMILGAGFHIDAWEVLMQMKISQEMWRKFNPMFKAFDRKELGILRFAFSALKPDEDQR